MPFSVVVETTDFDHWRTNLRSLMGDCRVGLTCEPDAAFAARVSHAAVGPLNLVEFQGHGGGLDLQRQQRSDMAVLWIPEVGRMAEQRPGSHELWCPGQGQGLWIAPEQELRGQSHGPCSGVSILVPDVLLAQLACAGGPSCCLNPFQVVRQPSLVSLLHHARGLIAAVRNQPSWVASSAALFWEALVHHCEQATTAPVPAPDPSKAAVTTTRFLELVTNALQEDPNVRFQLTQLALALYVSPRTLQGYLRQELDATPRQVWEALRRDLR